MTDKKMEYSSNKVIAFTAPSGAGKTTIVKRLLVEMPQLKFSVSATTREPRMSETHGKDYFFIPVSEFKTKIAAGEFVEWEEVYEGLFYGTLKSEVEHNNRQGLVTVFDIDVKGALKLKEYFGDDILIIFIQPPSLEALRSRLSNRKTESVKDLKRRLDKATEELNYKDRFDKIVLNDNLDDAIKHVSQLINAFLKE